jgi:hypothetical protein
VLLYVAKVELLFNPYFLHELLYRTYTTVVVWDI